MKNQSRMLIRCIRAHEHLRFHETWIVVNDIGAMNEQIGLHMSECPDLSHDWIVARWDGPINRVCSRIGKKPPIAKIVRWEQLISKYGDEFVAYLRCEGIPEDWNQIEEDFLTRRIGTFTEYAQFARHYMAEMYEEYLSAMPKDFRDALDAHFDWEGWAHACGSKLDFQWTSRDTLHVFGPYR